MELNTTFITEEEYYKTIRMQVLDEGLLSALVKGAANILGYASLTVFAGIGAAMLAKSAVSKEGKVNRFFKKIFGKNKDLDFDYYRGKSVARREIAKAESMEDKLADVIKAINVEDYDEAEGLFKDSRYTESPEAIKTIALKLTDVIGEPPLFVYPQGNKTYFMCKKILGIKNAKALAQSVLVALKQNKGYYKDVNTDF